MANEKERKAGILNDFDVSIGKIQQLVRERETNGNTLMKTISDNISAIDEKINELKGISDKAAETYNNIKRELEECKARSSEQERIIYQTTQEVDKITAQKLIIEEELNRYTEESRTKITDLQQQIDYNEENMRQLKSELEPLKDEKTRLEAQINELTQQNIDKDTQIQDIDEKKRQIAELTRDIQEKNAQILKMEEYINEKDAQINELTSHDSANTAKIQELERNLAEISTLQATKTQELDELKAENADLINRIMGATRAISEAMDTLEQLRTSKRSENTAQLLQKFQDTTALIQGISNSLQGLRGGKRYKKQKSRKNIKTRKNKKMRGGFTYGTSSSFRRKSKNSSKSSRSSSLFNKNKNTHRKIYKKM